MEKPTGNINEKINIQGAHPVDVHVGKRLRLRRKSLKLTQERLAHLVGLTFQQVQKYENGSNRISASRLFDLAHVLNTPVSYFFEEASTEDKAIKTKNMYETNSESCRLKVAEDASPYFYGTSPIKEIFIPQNEEEREIISIYRRFSSQEDRQKFIAMIRILGK